MVVNATRPHIDEVIRSIRADDLREVMLTRWTTSIDELADSCEQAPGVKLAILKDGKAVCLFGVVPISPTVGQGWLVGTDEIGLIGVEVAHACRRVVRTLLALDARRIQAFSADFHTQAHAWLELIGFERESVMRKYGNDGSDFICFAAT